MIVVDGTHDSVI